MFAMARVIRLVVVTCLQIPEDLLNFLIYNIIHMKQLEKLGLQGNRMLSDDQMKGVKGGGTGNGCTPDTHLHICIAAFCDFYDGYGNVYEGVCNTSCVCEASYGPRPLRP